MKRLILWLALLLPIFANAQVNGTIQKTSATGTIRGSFGSLGLDTLPRVTGVFIDGYILKYNAATNKWYASPDGYIAGLQDSLTKKANRTFDNVASGAIANVKLANSTISGVSLGSNLNTLTLGNGLIGTSYNGSSAVTARVDTTTIQTVSNFFPKGDTRYQTLANLSTDLTASATKYPSVNAVNTGLATKIGASFLSATSPIFYNSGTGVISSQAASGSLNGYVTTGAQTFAGAKTFTSSPVIAGGSALQIESGTTGNYTFLQAPVGLGASNTITFPSSSGTVALTSQLSSYLPLSGGTLTGDLNGTSATFTGNTYLATSSGNVGIGTTSLTARLQVEDSANTYVSHFSGLNQTNGIGMGTTSSNVAVIQGYTRTFSATNNISLQPDGGNLLIGTTTDAGYKLDVNGTFRATGATTFASLSGSGTRMVVADPSGVLSTQSIPPGGGGGSVTGVAVATANGLSGTSDGATVVPTLTLSTTVSGMVKANGSAFSAAVAGTDYTTPSSTETFTNKSGNISQWTNNSGYITSSALSPYAPLNSPTFTGTVSGITAAMVGAPSGSGTSTGTNTGDQTNISGNAGTATLAANSTQWNGISVLNGVYSSGTLTSIPIFNATNNRVEFGVQSNIQSFLGLGSNAYTSTTYAPLNSPGLTGTPTAPTQTQGDNSNNIATTAYVDALGGTILGAQKQISTTYTNISTSSTSTENLVSTNIPQSALSSDGDRVDFSYKGTFGLGSADKFVNLSIGGNVITVSGNASNKSTWNIEGYLMRTSSTTFRVFIQRDVDFVFTNQIGDYVVTDFNPLSFIVQGRTNDAGQYVRVQMGYIEAKKAP